MKRTCKKLLSVIMAMALCLGMCVGAMAAGETYSITIENSKTGHTYEAYQVFKGDLSENGGTLSNVTWGDGVNDSALLSALQSDDTFAACTDAASVAKALSEANDKAGANAAQMKAFAKIVGANLSSTVAGSANTQTDGKYVISSLTAGYYLVKDQEGSMTGKEDDAYTDFILKVVKNETVQPKGNVPTVEKKVKEDDKNAATNTDTRIPDYTLEDKYNDVADYEIGETVPFELIGTLPENYADYTSYKYVFHDTISKGLTFTEGSVKVYLNSVDEANLVSSGYEVSALTDVTDENGNVTGKTFSIAFNNLKQVTTTATDKIIVRYEATLNADAEVGLPGNPNEVYLKYSNNPNAGGDGPTGNTPEDKVVVFTYKLDVTKVDGQNAETKLAGAEFKLQNSDKSKWAKLTQGEDGKTTLSWVDNEADATVLRSDANGLFTVPGLDSGTYYLKETKAPDGYNLLANPVKVEVVATTVNNQEWDGTDNKALTALQIKIDDGTAQNGDTSTGTVSGTVTNNKGATLPGTGGIGTTIFYIVGGVLVVGAGVLLITKKRMAK